MTRSRRFLGLAATTALLLLPTGHEARAAATTVREPAFGLPHFHADTDVELARENGREIAKDRLGQIILLSRVGRGTLYQAFGLLDAGTLNSDLQARQTGYTSSELNLMYERLPQRERDLVLAYCEGVNDTIEAIYAGALPEPMEVTVLRSTIFELDADLFGNATNLSDQVDPFYRAPGGADPERPNAGFQFTPELAMAVGVLEVRNFGLGGFQEADRFDELQALIAKHGATNGTAIWDDLNFANDPLAPVTVPDDTTPGFGGPLALGAPEESDPPLAAMSAQPLKASKGEGAEDRASSRARALAELARRYPGHAYAEAMRARRAREQARAELASRLGAWPKLGSYAWLIAGNRSATGHPWVGGFPQTGIQTPSIMHFAENRTAEGIAAIGMEFPGAPLILIGQTDSVAYTTTTAQLPIVDTFFETIVLQESDVLRYDDEGLAAEVSMRSELLRGGVLADEVRTYWRTHERNGNGGSRPVLEFLGDVQGTAEGGTELNLVDAGAFDVGLMGGFVALLGGTGAGQIRLIASVPDADTLTVAAPFTIAPDSSSVYVAVGPSGSIVAVAMDSVAWLEESTAVLGFAQYQRAQTILDVRAATRLIPSTHNFLAADHGTWNGIGTENGNGNIGYWTSGFSRIRQGGEDPRLPLPGGDPNPLVVVSGAVDAASETTLTDSTAFLGLQLEPNPFNTRYDDPDGLHPEYIVSITSGHGYKQSRRIASNTSDTLSLESAWGVVPQAGDGFEVYEIVGMPEAINPAEGYTANWNNKSATADPGDGFGRQHRVIFILERLAAESSWDRAKQRQLNDDVAGLDGRGAYGRYLLPRLRQAVDAVGNGGNEAVDTVLMQLETHQAPPTAGRLFVDVIADDMRAGEMAFIDTLVNRLAEDIYADEYDGAVSVPGGGTALALVQHAVDAAAGDVEGAYAQQHADYFNSADWRIVLRDRLSTQANAGIPPDTPRGFDRYAHPLSELDDQLIFEPTPDGNRGVWEQIVEVGPTVKGEFMFPLGQSGFIEGSLTGVTSIDPNTQSLHPIWRDWRFVPMLAVSGDLQTGGNPDSDGDGVFDGYERWYFGDLSRDADDDADADQLELADEFAAGSDPTLSDTDGDGVLDGLDEAPQDRLLAPEPRAWALQIATLATLLALARRRRVVPTSRVA